MDECLALANLGASINIMPLSVWNKLSLPELSPTCMTLKLADHLISRSVGVADDVFVKVGTFHFPADFVVIDFDADPRVPLILRRSFLNTRKALIDVYEGELTLRVGKKAITFNLDQTLRYSAKYNDMTANKINVIDMACEEYSDFLLEEVDAFLTLEDDPTSPEVNHYYFDTEGDILLIEAFLNDDPSLPPPTQGKYLPQVRKELKICKAKNDKSSIDEPLEVEHKDLPPHLEYAFLEGDDKLLSNSHPKDQENTTFTCPYRTFAYRRMPFGLCNAPSTFQRCMMAIFHDMIKKMMEVFMDDFLEKSHFMVKEGIVLGHKISKNGIEVDKAKVDVITKLPHPTTVKAPILIVPDGDLPFKLMYDANDLAIGVILRKRQENHFRPVHYASKTMTEAESHYTTTEKEMLVVVYAFEKFWSYLIMNKSIVYMDHLALKDLFAKKDSKARLLRWVLLLQEFKFKVTDKKGAENLAADHLSQLENPRQNVLDPKEINEAFPLETLNMVSFRGNVAPAKEQILQRCEALLLGRPLLVQNFCGSSHPAVCSRPRKPLKFLRLATMDPPRDTMARTTPPKRCLTLVFIGPQSIVLPMTWSNLVTLVNVKEIFHNEMKCLKIPSNFVKYPTYGASISWGRSRPHKGTNIYSWLSITCRNRSKRKRSPLTTLELFANSRNLSLLVSMGCHKPGHLAARLGCAETKVATWDDLAFKLITLGWNVKHRNFANRCCLLLELHQLNKPPLKDKSMWSDQEKRIQKIDHLARSLLIQGLPNDIYSLIDSNKTAKDLWDALTRHMLGSEYGEQDRKVVKCGYSKDNCELNFKFLNNLQPEWKQYATMMRHNKNPMDINIDALYNILKQNQRDVNFCMGSKKKTVVITSDPLALIAEKTKVSKSKEKVVVSSDSEGSDADDFSELKKINALLVKAFNRRKFYSKPTNNNLRTSSTSQSANKKQEFVKSDDKQVVKKTDEKKQDMSRVKCYNYKKEGNFAKDCKKAKV
nr:retrovirus-related Pol polyprotein from transposon 17.6 [Tanacetum cinerariifolium]